MAKKQTDGDVRKAERLFRGCVAWTRDTQLKLFELGDARRLAQLLRNAGRRDEARNMRAESYNWFTEGFDAPKDAKALLRLTNSA